MVESGSYTPEQIERRRAIAQALIAPGKTRPITHWAEGLDLLGKTALGTHMMNRADEMDRERRSADNKVLEALLGGGQATAGPTAPPAAPVGNAGASPMGKLPALGSRVYDQNEFNPLDAAVATPKELAAGVPAPPQYASLIGKAAVDNDLPPQLLAAQLKQESGFNPNAVSSAGATGISQFMPGTAREMGVTDPRDPTQAIPAGARYLRQNIDKFGGSVPLGLAAYNAGPGRVERSGGDISRLPAETQGYVANISGAAQSPVAAALSQPAQGGGGILAGATPQQRAAIVAGMQASEGSPARAIAQALMTQLAKPKEYSYQTLPDGTILRMDPRGGPPQPVYQAPTKPTYGVIGEDEFGKKTYGWIDPAKRTAEPSGGASATPAAPATVTGPDGKPIPIPAGVDPKKFRQDVTSASADAATGKKTEVQAKSEKFGNKMELAESNLKDLDDKFTETLSGNAARATEYIPLVGKSLQTNEYQKYVQARDNFITALLRDESGAAIGTAEFNRYEKELFPQPGDGPDVVAQKRQARKVAIEGMKKAAGPGYKSPELLPAKTSEPTVEDLLKKYGAK